MTSTMKRRESFFQRFNSVELPTDALQGLNGFEELRKHIKQGNEFSREVAAIVQERAELESSYAKSLSKLSNKLTKACACCIGTMVSAWGTAASEMESEAELHRGLATSFQEDIYKPLKVLSETQYKIRKPIENMVDKAAKGLLNRREEEQKMRKHAFSCCKETEKLSEQLQDAKAGKSKQMSDKDITKLEKKCRSAATSLAKADTEYHDSFQKAEVARQEWEAEVYNGSSQMQKLEEERISQMLEYLQKYQNSLAEIGPKLIQICDRLREAVMVVDVQRDLAKVVDQKGTGPHQPEQLLFESYAEDFNNTMNPERRRKALTNYLLYLQQDVEREKKGREGVEKLLDVYKNTPNFADQGALDDAKRKLKNVSATLNFLEASYYKVSCALAQLNGKPKPDHRFAPYIEQVKDKQSLQEVQMAPHGRHMFPHFLRKLLSDTLNGHGHGHKLHGQNCSVLRLPASIAMEGAPDLDLSLQGHGRGSADGGHDDRHSYGDFDDDEFDDYNTNATVLCTCQAIYEYQANMSDELTIRPGSVLIIIIII
ncbi:nostrin-like isoform X3 [Lingula anatina]|uniref:Nostrin-like isoform X3 n=1 Tax=Lingula anatina TaxID=7574 RepID=A0A1S3IGT1_LINAN|nr:nostrin-like isoform X3 [Lingula anatina]|eukprot:XP_013397348.1 nostrin-like isoform X3 [Lingula anatina]